MALDQETVRRIATLARLKVPEEKLTPLATELNNILDWIEQLAEVDTDKVDPMTSVIETIAPQRDDMVTDKCVSNDILQNAPNTANVLRHRPFRNRDFDSIFLNK